MHGEAFSPACVRAMARIEIPLGARSPVFHMRGLLTQPRTQMLGCIASPWRCEPEEGPMAAFIDDGGYACSPLDDGLSAPGAVARQ